MRSLTLPPGLNHSSLAKMRAAPREKCGSSTSGVFPIAARTLPAAGAATAGAGLVDKGL